MQYLIPFLAVGLGSMAGGMSRYGLSLALSAVFRAFVKED
jgi:hypothetical protein